jgi:hypothetical protein
MNATTATAARIAITGSVTPRAMASVLLLPWLGALVDEEEGVMDRVADV